MTSAPCGMAFGHVVFGLRLVQPVVDLVPVIGWIDADDFRRVGAHIHCTRGPIEPLGDIPPERRRRHCCKIHVTCQRPVRVSGEFGGYAIRPGYRALSIATVARSNRGRAKQNRLNRHSIVYSRSRCLNQYWQSRPVTQSDSRLKDQISHSISLPELNAIPHQDRSTRNSHTLQCSSIQPNCCCRPIGRQVSALSLTIWLQLFVSASKIWSMKREEIKIFGT
ncbi:hypothetical protein FHW72_002777 [Ochrobactrum sp. RC6B]|nr:hypothetical protein [Ochrobactrum sp. RC6B]